MDGNEFKSRFLPFSGLIYRISFVVTGDREDSEDIVQEVYEKLWKIRETLSAVQNDEAYIISVTRNMALDRYRYNTRRQTVSVTSVTDLTEEEFDEKKNEQKEMLRSIENVLCTLPQSQQMVVRLRHFTDLSVPQIAETMKLTQANVRQLLSRARRTIKEKFEKLYEY
ncbi:RNA polymerase sigma factor [Proteiniphilum sp. UBA1028]|jgi:RNA polymerase sigma-70 factor (ECF subfamily)|uniref:RNA polymerase sigma factor n=1 Tax=Proteiniphilum sp. UBA1028 TaxID=1947251 RepID=UPI000E981375|nr:RNA polymerase sigma factor [Proteiniphilum sp. UBA1028]HBG58722.1 RNA polymerase subunit sigma-70 [Porphyromonadaceae bacterium]